MAKNFDRMEDSNLSANPTIHEVSDPARRVLVRGGLAAAVAGLFGPRAAGSLAGCAATAGRGGGAGAGRGDRADLLAALLVGAGAGGGTPPTAAGGTAALLGPIYFRAIL
ncbi:MAG: hypothetical protein OJK14_18385, partial [Achromobacter sp.]|nr:hypothetical protein [Achromobacter sp.]